jgi:hypothetical protein
MKDFRRRWAVAAIILVGCSMTPVAKAREPLDLSCGPSVDGPHAGPGTHVVTASGSYSCVTRRPSIGVIVCLEYNGLLVTCEQETASDAKVAEASVDFACLPGVWTATATGVATGGPPGAAAGVAIPIDCDPLS